MPVHFDIPFTMSWRSEFPSSGLQQVSSDSFRIEGVPSYCSLKCQKSPCCDSFICLDLQINISSPLRVTVELKRYEKDLQQTFLQVAHDITSSTCIWKLNVEELVAVTYKRDFTFQVTFELEDCLPKDKISECPSVPEMSIHYPCLHSLSEDLAKLMDGSSDPDIEFQFEDHVVKAHKAIVSVRSRVLAIMFKSDMQEGRTKMVKIPDIAPDTFRPFLRYLYTGKLDDMNTEDAMSLYDAADKYEVLSLVKRCSVILTKCLTVENACEFLIFADAHSDFNFIEEIIDFMLREKMPFLDSWKDFCNSYPSLAVKVLNRFKEN